jgi:hypothetical protein
MATDLHNHMRVMITNQGRIALAMCYLTDALRSSGHEQLHLCQCAADHLQAIIWPAHPSVEVEQQRGEPVK